MNKDILKNISYGVYVVSTIDNDRATGCIANSIMQVTSDTIALSVNHQNFTNGCIKKFKKFAISILPTDIDDNIIPIFGFQSGKEVDKFGKIEFETINGLNIVTGAIGYIVCEIIDSIETETHSLFLAKILDGDVLNNKEPMTYSYYHKVKKGLSPKTAPTYIDEEIKTNQISYKCKICGYIYNGDLTKEPDNYICPICKQPKTVFEKI